MKVFFLMFLRPNLCCFCFCSSASESWRQKKCELSLAKMEKWIDFWN